MVSKMSRGATAMRVLPSAHKAQHTAFILLFKHLPISSTVEPLPFAVTPLEISAWLCSYGGMMLGATAGFITSAFIVSIVVCAVVVVVVGIDAANHVPAVPPIASVALPLLFRA